MPPTSSGCWAARRTAARAAALDTYLVTVADHGLNASTFAARVVASTQAGLTSSVLAAYGALKGPLHGGAPGPVLDMLDAVGTPDRAEPVLRDMLDRGERLMGFGHRIYRVRDPRADALKAALGQAAALAAHRAGAGGRSRRAEAAARRKSPTGRSRPMSSSSPRCCSMRSGFPRDAFTAVFAMGRTGGLDRPRARAGDFGPADPPEIALCRPACRGEAA